MANRDVVSARFRVALANRLKIRFGKVLSAQRFSDLYNLNAHGSNTISRETARLWIRGNSMPDYGHLAVLIQWLGINPEDFLSNKSISGSGNQEVKQTPPDNKNHFAGDLLALWDEFDPETQRTVMVIAKALSIQKTAKHSTRGGILNMQALITGRIKPPTEDCQM